MQCNFLQIKTIFIDNAVFKKLNKVGDLDAESTMHGVIKMHIIHLKFIQWGIFPCSQHLATQLVAQEPAILASVGNINAESQAPHLTH